ncbi:MAG: riboflavin synthase [Deltaproteobacteria bacterium]|nr:riboflavin synthase [Deltaproteobacteria bacterium]
MVTFVWKDMFTGIIEDIGEILQIERRSGITRIRIKTNLPLKEINQGDSIAVDGVCLTVTSTDSVSFYCDVSSETEKITTLGQKRKGEKVNLERSLKVEGRLHGHLVTGHVECVGIIVEKKSVGESFQIGISVPYDVVKYIVKKGSIAVDGISLTVNDQSDNRFMVNIVPYTASKTTIGMKKLGDKVNIETDILVKYIERLISFEKKGIDYDFLFRYGYIKG